VILAGLRVATKPATDQISFARRSAHRRAAFLHGESPMTKLNVDYLCAAGGGRAIRQSPPHTGPLVSRTGLSVHKFLAVRARDIAQMAPIRPHS
jgi:hypothetical protein